MKPLLRRYSHRFLVFEKAWAVRAGTQIGPQVLCRHNLQKLIWVAAVRYATAPGTRCGINLLASQKINCFIQSSRRQNLMRQIAMQEEYKFTVVLEPLDEGGFLVLVPALPEVVSHGESEDDALANAEDAIRLVIGYRQDHGEPIPAETTPQLRQVKVAVQA